MVSILSHRKTESGFTLIELSIVLVIIGLIVGGVLVGQDLIRAAYIRAQITQIERFNTAVNTFYGKYQAIPGDMNDSVASANGFSMSVHNGASSAGQGDGNGIIDGNFGPSNTYNIGGMSSNNMTTVLTPGGESAVFWMDLSSKTAGNLIEGSFSKVCESCSSSTGPDGILPVAKLGKGNYVYAFEINGANYYGVELFMTYSTGIGYGLPGMTVAEAYNIDKKVDDGYPTTGNVAAMVAGPYLGQSTTILGWPVGGNANSGLDNYVPSGSLFSGVAATAGTAAGPTTCFDAPNVGGTTNYSMEINKGAGLNCALIFRMQGGD